MKKTFQGFVRLTASEPITSKITFSDPELLRSRPSPLLTPKSVLLSRASMRQNFRAFGRVELFATIASLALLGSVVLPALASTKARSQSAQCLNNLRLMGRAVQIWGGDHYDEPPWRTLISEGGTLPGAGDPTKPGVAWYEYAFMSNELVTPRILGCPADQGVIISTDFVQYVSAPFRQFATSYILNLHSSTEFPTALLFGDRNLRFDSYGATTCIARVSNGGSIDPKYGPTSWTNAVHGPFGNFVTMDGNVAETTSPEMRAALQASPKENGGVHLLKPR
jgi:hypothetical protein